VLSSSGSNNQREKTLLGLIDEGDCLPVERECHSRRPFRSTAVKTSNIPQRTTFLYICQHLWHTMNQIRWYIPVPTKPPIRNAALFSNIFRLTSVSPHLWFLSTLSFTLSQQTITRVVFMGWWPVCNHHVYDRTGRQK